MHIELTATGRLAGKTALITGGGSGIGKAAALLFASHGAKVGILERDVSRAERVRSEIEAAGGSALALEADISQDHEVMAAAGKLTDRFGGLDVVFANAGINGVLSSIEEMTLAQWNDTLDINLKGTFLTVKHSIPFLKINGGSIIITSSVNGNRVFSNFGFSAYSTSKAGQVAFMKMAALELAHQRIRVNAICPGATKTNISQSTERSPSVDDISIPVEFPQGSQPLEDKPGTAEQVARLALFLASDESAHITGTEIYIDGAESLLRG